MAPYDSESSGDEEEENYTETNVLLGYASKEPTDDAFSQLGGFPTWLDPSTPPPASLAKCKVCNDLMTLLLQLNGDLPEQFPGHERRLYLFNCRRRTCQRKSGSVRAFRGVRATKMEDKSSSRRKEDVEKQQPPQQETKRSADVNIGNSLFGTTSSSSNAPANPFSTSTSSSANASSNPFSTSTSNPFSTSASTLPPLDSLAAKPPQRPSTQEEEQDKLPETFASKVRISSPTPPPPSVCKPSEPWPPQEKFPTPYPSYHLDADYETLEPTPLPLPTQAMDIDAAESAATGGGGGGKDDASGSAFESALDKTFLRFADRLAQNPEQVLRYEFGGAPLLYSTSDGVGALFASPSASAQNVKVTTSTASTTSRLGGAGGRGMPPCANCGRGRVFECQLTPQAIAELEVDETGLEGMEWGTLIVGVCGADCVPSGGAYSSASGAGASVDGGKTTGVGYLEEWVGVQWEEVAQPGPRR
ncbi:MAG: hypothetical protein M1819_003057 [Sarea resinae]|nr:MAG: hypothetical protein M1819_003057 [Sarea resinae]